MKKRLIITDQHKKYGVYFNLLKAIETGDYDRAESILQTGIPIHDHDILYKGELTEPFSVSARVSRKKDGENECSVAFLHLLLKYSVLIKQNQKSVVKSAVEAKNIELVLQLLQGKVSYRGHDIVIDNFSVQPKMIMELPVTKALVDVMDSVMYREESYLRSYVTIAFQSGEDAPLDLIERILETGVDASILAKVVLYFAATKYRGPLAKEKDGMHPEFHFYTSDEDIKQKYHMESMCDTAWRRTYTYEYVLGNIFTKACQLWTPQYTYPIDVLVSSGFFHCYLEISWDGLLRAAEGDLKFSQSHALDRCRIGSGTGQKKKFPVVKGTPFTTKNMLVKKKGSDVLSSVAYDAMTHGEDMGRVNLLFQYLEEKSYYIKTKHIHFLFINTCAWSALSFFTTNDKLTTLLTARRKKFFARLFMEFWIKATENHHWKNDPHQKQNCSVFMNIYHVLVGYIERDEFENVYHGTMVEHRRKYVQMCGSVLKSALPSEEEIKKPSCSTLRKLVAFYQNKNIKHVPWVNFILWPERCVKMEDLGLALSPLFHPLIKTFLILANIPESPIYGIQAEHLLSVFRFLL